jgi:hypothetical protein
MKARIKLLNHQLRQARATEGQHTMQLRLRELEPWQRRQCIFDAEDKIKEQCHEFSERLEHYLRWHESSGSFLSFTGLLSERI